MMSPPDLLGRIGMNFSAFLGERKKISAGASHSATESNH
jgi:hypothetical protein